MKRRKRAKGTAVRGNTPTRAGERTQRKRQAREKPYEFLDHPADVGFRARGRRLEELFANAAQALVECGWELEPIRVRRAVPVRAEGHDLESLLYNWLSEILSLMDAEDWVFKEFRVARVKLADGEASGEVRGVGRGERFEPARHRGRTYVKAVTYHQLAVQKTRDGWQATVYLDV